MCCTTKLAPERTPFALQQAFQRALTSHAQYGGDLGILTELLENGAHVHDVSLIALCDETMRLPTQRGEWAGRDLKPHRGTSGRDELESQIP